MSVGEEKTPERGHWSPHHLLNPKLYPGASLPKPISLWSSLLSLSLKEFLSIEAFKLSSVAVRSNWRVGERSVGGQSDLVILSISLYASTQGIRYSRLE